MGRLKRVTGRRRIVAAVAAAWLGQEGRGSSFSTLRIHPMRVRKQLWSVTLPLPPLLPSLLPFLPRSPRHLPPSPPSLFPTGAPISIRWTCRWIPNHAPPCQQQGSTCRGYGQAMLCCSTLTDTRVAAADVWCLKWSGRHLQQRRGRRRGVGPQGGALQRKGKE